MKDNKETILLIIVIVLAAWNIFNTNTIKTDVKSYKSKIENIQVEVDSLVFFLLASTLPHLDLNFW